MQIMMRFPGSAGILWMFILMIVSCHGYSAPGAVDSSKPVVLGYYPSWNTGIPPEKINYRLFTHLIHAFVNPDKKGGIRVEGNLPSRTFTKLAHDANVRVLFAIGGEDSGSSLSALAKNEKATDDFIKAVVKLARDNDYDGIDVDWEFPGKSDAENFVRFVKKLHAGLVAANPRALLTMAVPAIDYGGKWFDGRLASDVDFIQIMSYELHGPWKSDDGKRYSHSGHNSPLHETDTDPIDGRKLSFQKFVDYWVAKGFPKNKILVGIPCFGRGFAVGKWAQEPERLSSHSEVAYKATGALLAAGWTRHWDAQAGVPWLGNPAGNELVSYDDRESARAKGAWARTEHLRGVFFWEITQDYVNGRNELVEAAREGLGLAR